MSEILNQDQTLNYILEIINSKKSASFIRKSDGENIVLSYGSLKSISFHKYRKKLVHFNIPIWDIPFQLFIRSELIIAFSNATLLGISPVSHRHGLWEMEEKILNYYFLQDILHCDMNFHMGFIKIPNKNKLINPNTIFSNLENSITCDKYTISEHDKLPKTLNTEQILIRSSNIGAVRVAQKVGVEKYRAFLNSLDLLNVINFDLDEIGTPLPFKWGKCKLATTSYGHGITTTPLQLARAYAILGNGGYKIEPSLLQKKTIHAQKKEQIVSEKTSNEINLMLRKVVSLNEGTANFANIEGYEVAGKTGTALKYNSKEKLNTFVSIFPASRPLYVLLVMLDEPKPAPNFVYEFPPSEKFPNGYKHKGENRNTSGWNAVVVAGKIIEKIGPILAINNLQASNNF